MSTIIWKGINSDTLKGLVICKLPPISKPKIRTNIIQIDGKDGCIVQKLGYESYIKELQIGLSYNYDIDEIIDYFSGEGNIIFSNEPDKYYKVQIIDQIDYESLLRFKTATIKFHCQPFKYLYQEHKQIFDNPIDSVNVVNVGLEPSKPVIKLFGSGTIEFKLENEAIFRYTFPENETEVTIDSEKQDAYLDDVLKNRNMLGEFPILKSGKNEISWTGNITRIEILANSRWL